MIINEQALLKVMKDEFKGRGFHVAVFDGHGSEHVLIHGAAWLVTMERKNAPGKIRGYVAEQVGEWPKAGEAYLVKKEEVQTEQLNVVMDRLRYYLELFKENQVERIKPTQLLMGKNELWQCCKAPDMVLMDPAFANIIGDSRVPVRWTGNNIATQGEISSIYLCVIRQNETTGQILEHLGKIRWVSEE